MTYIIIGVLIVSGLSVIIIDSIANVFSFSQSISYIISSAVISIYLNEYERISKEEQVVLSDKIFSEISCICVTYNFAYFHTFYSAIYHCTPFFYVCSLLGAIFFLYISCSPLNLLIYYCGYIFSFFHLYALGVQILHNAMFINIFSSLFCVLLIVVQNKKYEKKTVKITKDHNKRKDFINFIAHEIRVFMQGINMMIDHLTSYWNTLSVKKRKSYIDIIKSSLSELTHLTIKTLNVENNFGVNVDLRLELYEINDLISEIIAELKPFSTMLSVKIHFYTEKKMKIFFDVAKMKHVLRNLVSNALKYGNGFDIYITVEQVSAKNILIQVKDYGFGIDPIKKKKIFQPFWVGDNVDTIYASGYGLFLAYTFVAQHAGKLGVKDNYPHGSIFYISLPIVAQKGTYKSLYTDSNLIILSAPTHVQVSNIQRNDKKVKTLIVDDDFACSLTLKLMLETLDCEIVTAQSFRHAEFLILEKHFDIIFIDAMVKNEDLQEFFFKMKKIITKHEIKPLIVVQSGIAYQNFRKNYSKIRPSSLLGYLQKPYSRSSVETLFRVVGYRSKIEKKFLKKQ